MKQTLREFMSVVLIVVLSLTSIPFFHNTPVHLEAKAICCCKNNFDKTKYTLTGDMAQDVATIAKSQKGRTCDQFGYLGVDRGAWCDEFAADCIENAGGDSSIVAHGGDVPDFESKMAAKGALRVTSPQVGDLVFFYSASKGRLGHVEIVTKVGNGIVYCAGGNNGSYPGQCNGERKVSSIASGDLSLHHYLRPAYSTTVAPTSATLTIDETDIRMGETFTFTMIADQPTSHYWFSIIRANTGEEIISTSTNGTFSTSFLSCGHYHAWCTAVNPAGTVDSNHVDFYVYGGAPTEGSIVVDKDTISLGESVSFSFLSNAYFTRNYIAIYDPDGNRCYEGWQENSFVYMPQKTGTYSAYASLSTPNGGIDTPWINFTVKNDSPTFQIPAPTYATLTVDKTDVQMGKDFTFTMTADQPTSYFWFTIIRTNSGEEIISTSTNGTFSTSFLSCGHYHAWCTAVNSAGTVDSNHVDFYVYGGAPTEGSIAVDKDTISLGKTVSFSFTSNAYFTRNYLAIYDPDGNRCYEGWQENGFVYVPQKTGTYSAYASLSTPNGGIDTPWIHFAVKNDFPTLLIITQQPVDVRVPQGERAKATVKATGENLSYQWYLMNAGSTKFSKSSITTATYAVTMSDKANGRSVYCVITDAYGTSVQTDTVTLTQATPLSILTQPTNVKVAIGNSAKATVVAEGEGLTYQWYLKSANGTKFSRSSVTRATYAVTMSDKVDGRSLYCVITDAYGTSVQTDTIKLTAAMAITSQPANVVLPTGDTTFFTVEASGVAPLKYQWQCSTDGGTTWKNSNFSTAKSDTLKVPATAARNGYKYRCRVEGANGEYKYTGRATLTVTVKIISEPTSVKKTVGETASFTVKATGVTPITYQWQVSTNGGKSWKNSAFSTAQSATLNVPVTAARNGYQYRCVVTGSNGQTTTSDAAKLTVS